GLEDILNRHVLTLEFTGSDGAAVEDEARHIEPNQSHRAAWNRFVTSDNRHNGIEIMPAAQKFDRICDDLPAHKAGLHAFRAHGYAVADGDGVELHRRAAGGADAFFDFHRKIAEMEVAGHRFNPGVGDADDGLGQRFIIETDGLEHGAGRRTVPAVEKKA